jgi:hypothetical protein
MDALIASRGADKLRILSDVYGHATKLQTFNAGRRHRLLTSIISQRAALGLLELHLANNSGAL